MLARGFDAALRERRTSRAECAPARPLPFMRSDEGSALHVGLVEEEEGAEVGEERGWEGGGHTYMLNLQFRMS